MNNSLIVLDLPQLRTINLGSFALFGQWGNDNCKLTMKSINIYLIQITNRSS